MRGHEYARSQVRNHLASAVPVRLAAIRAALEVESPANPPETAYLLSDELPMDPELYPCVVVMSTGAPRFKAQSVSAAGDSADYICTYDLRVVVACRFDESHGDLVASSDRDRLLLAVREALLARVDLPEDIDMVLGNLREDTGAAMQDLRGRPLAAGQINFNVAVLETLHALPTPDAIEVSEVDVAGHGQGVDDITPN